MSKFIQYYKKYFLTIAALLVLIVITYTLTSTRSGQYFIRSLLADISATADISVETRFDTETIGAGKFAKLEIVVTSNEAITDTIDVETRLIGDGVDRLNVQVLPGKNVQSNGDTANPVLTLEVTELAAGVPQVFEAFVVPLAIGANEQEARVPTRLAQFFAIAQVHAQNEPFPCDPYDIVATTNLLFPVADADNTNNVSVAELIVNPTILDAQVNQQAEQQDITVNPGETKSITFTFTPDQNSNGGAIVNTTDIEGNEFCNVVVVAAAQTACNDGIDNDNDGNIDIADDGCINPDDDNEVEGNIEFAYRIAPEVTEGSPVIHTVDLRRINQDIDEVNLTLNFDDPDTVNFSLVGGSIVKGAEPAENIDIDLDGDNIIAFGESDDVRITFQLAVELDGLEFNEQVEVDFEAIANFEVNQAPQELIQAALLVVQNNQEPAAEQPQNNNNNSGGGGGGGGVGGVPGQGGGVPVARGGGGGFGDDARNILIARENDANRAAAPNEETQSTVCEFVEPDVTDTDGDGLIDSVEQYLGSDVNNPDTDGDGRSDYTEFYNNLNYLSPEPRTRIWKDLHAKWQIDAVTGLYPVIIQGTPNANAVLQDFADIIKGSEGTYFFPDLFAKRGNVAQMLYERVKVLCADDELEIPELPFPDVPKTHPNYEAIAFFYGQGVLNGYPDGTFKPDLRVNRAEASKLIVNTFGLLVEKQERILGQNFGDVAFTDWFEPFVNSMRTLDISRGYRQQGINEFKPGRNITRAEIAELIRKSAAKAEELYLGEVIFGKK